MTGDGGAQRLFRTLVSIVVVVATLAPAPSFAQSRDGARDGGRDPSREGSRDPLQAARELFQEAYRDEQEQRFELALSKFQRVAQVKESASVRYRIGSVLESLGRLREARDEFRALAVQHAQGNASEQEIASSAAENAARLDKRIPHLVLAMEHPPPPDVRVTLDGAPVPTPTTPRAIEVDPGEHVVAAAEDDVRAFERKVVIKPGESVPVKIAFDGTARSERRTSKTWGVVGLASGGALIATAAVMLLVRQNDIDELHVACPGGDCPSSRRSELEDTHGRAQLLGPLGLSLGALGFVAAGIGTYLLLKPAPRTDVSRDRHRPSTFRLGGGVGPAGVTLGVGGTF